MFRLFSALILLSITQLGFAETELIDLSGYSTGDIPKYLLGEGLIVEQEVLDGELKKYVTGQNDNGRIEYMIPNLSRNFEITFEVDPWAGRGSAFSDGNTSFYNDIVTIHRWIPDVEQINFQ